MLNNQTGFTLIEAVLVVVTLAAIGLAGWTWWQSNQVDSENTANQQMDIAEKPTEEPVGSKETQNLEPAAKKSHPSFATGQVSFTDNDDARIAVLVNNSMRDEPLEAIWVEYGQDKTKLSSTSEKNSSHLAYNTNDLYGEFQIEVPASKLEAGATYFYRAAGETRENEVIYGGTAAFSARK